VHSVFLLLGWLAPQALPAPAPPEVVVPDSLVSYDGRVRPAERRTLTLYEPVAGRRDPARLEIVYLRLPARAGAGRSPIVFLMGGPGVPASLIGRVPPYWSLFDRLSADRDVILLDQRGSGLSTPSLGCRPGSPPDPGLFQSSDALRDGLRRTYAACVDDHRAAGMPMELFTPRAVAGDVEAIRLRLGAERVSLLGFSYGTRLVLEYARAYPDRVDQLVLQGTFGFEDGVRRPTRVDSILIHLGRAAAQDSIARRLVPDLVAAVTHRLRALDSAPVVVPVAGTTGDTVRLTVGAGGFRAILSGRLGDARLPALLASLTAGDSRVLGAIAGATYRDLASGTGSAFGLAMYCGSTAPDIRYREAAADTANSILGEIFDNRATAPDLCRDIGLRPSPAGTMPDARLAGPALFISGLLDDRTVPENAERARRYFVRSQTVTVENGGHELLPLDMVQSLVAEFFSSGRVSTERLTVAPPRFLTVAEALVPPRRR
jgi:pimeloyl-ACP methyl ester carboxylesterase